MAGGQDNATFVDWWHERPLEQRITHAFDARSLRRLPATNPRFELLDHLRLGRMVAVDGRLIWLEEDAAPREMQVRVALGARPVGQRVLVIGAGACLGEVVLDAGVNAVLHWEAHPDLTTLLTEVGARTEGIVAVTQAPEGLFDMIFVEDPLPEGITASDVAQRLAEGAIVVSMTPVFVTRPPRRHRGPAARLHDALALPYHQIWMATAPLALGGYLAFQASALYPLTLDLPIRPRTGRHYNAALHRAAFVLPSWWATMAVVDAEVAGDAEAPWWYEQTQQLGVTQALAMTRIHHERSDFQEIEAFEHCDLGRVLTLDGTVQASHADERIYHELAVHVPLLAKARTAATVLIVGGGDGGILREVLRHACVTRVVMVEIDPRVIAVSDHYLGIQGDYRDPRVAVVIGDAAVYVREAAGRGETFDLIVVDATDSTTPSFSLWTDGFFAALAACTARDGACIDSDILIGGRAPQLSRDWQGEALADVRRSTRFFAHLSVYQAVVPVYPGGHFTFFLYSHKPYPWHEPVTAHTGWHYNAALHRAVFQLPAWIEATVAAARAGR
jgi:spermidine synthase